jgi:ankyrin repeat protein
LKFALEKQVEDATSEGSLVLSFFFYASGTELQNSIEGLFRVLLVQLLEQDVCSKATFQELCRKRWISEGKKNSRRLTWYESELQANFEKLVLECSARRKTTIFVDAIDECKDKSRDCLIRCFHVLKGKAQLRQNRPAIFFTCRPYPDGRIDADFQIRLEEESQNDIQSYIEEELRLSDETQAATEGLKQILKEKADGVFLWLRLIIRQIHELSSKGLNLKTIKSRILESPRELDRLYRDLLENIEGGEVPEAGKLFQWICFTARPLSLDELRTAMTVHLTGPKGSLEEYEDENNPNCISNERQMKKRMVHLSRGLLDIAMAKSADGKTLVGFYHETIKDFMIREGLQYLNSRQKGSLCLAETAHFHLANACLQYLSTREICTAFSGTQKGSSTEFHFVDYAAAYWLSYAVDAEKGSWGEKVTWPSQSVLNTWVNICKTSNPASLQCPQEGTTLMHIAGQHGLERLAKSICAEEATTLAKTTRKSSQMSVLTQKKTKGAVKNDRQPHINAVRTTIQDSQQGSLKGGSGMQISRTQTRNSTKVTQKSDYRVMGSQTLGKRRAKVGLPDIPDIPKEQSFMINAKDSSGQLPIHSAAGYNQLEMVKILHQNGSDLNSTDKKGYTPLCKAVFNGHLEVVKFLYEHGAATDIHTPIKDGWTPLNAASSNGHLEVVKFLYKHGAAADIHTPDQNGWTPLNAASSNGYLEVVKFLYKHGADADIHIATTNGRTPLHSASFNGHLEVVKFLYEHGADADIHTAINYGHTPLYAASAFGHLEVVKFLYEHGAAADIHTPIKSGWTPLNIASSNGHLEVVKFLYKHGAVVDIHTATNDSQTPLYAASRYGHLEVVKFLYEHGADADIHTPDQNGWTPLNTASSNGNLEVVKFLYKHGADADIHTPDQNGQTPLYAASRNGHLEVVKFLYKHEADVDIHTPIKNGWTPLNAASSNGHLEVVKFLYKHGADADIHTPDQDGWTPLNAASSEGYLEVVKFLYEHGADADIHTPDQDGWTPLNAASSEGHLKVVKFLYKHGADADIHIATTKGHTPLHSASLNGHLEVVKFLEPLANHPDFRDECGRTPLFLAAVRGHTTVVQFLLLRNALADAKDRYCATPLSAAVRNGHEEVVRVLIPLTQITIDFEGGLGQNLVWWAARSGRATVIEVVRQWAQRTGIRICENLPMLELSLAESDKNSRWCDVCTRYISSKSPFHACKVCHDFDICLECFGIGVNCFDVSHGWALRHLDSSGDIDS